MNWEKKKEKSSVDKWLGWRYATVYKSVREKRGVTNCIFPNWSSQSDRPFSFDHLYHHPGSLSR